MRSSTRSPPARRSPARTRSGSPTRRTGASPSSRCVSAAARTSAGSYHDLRSSLTRRGDRCRLTPVSTGRSLKVSKLLPDDPMQRTGSRLPWLIWLALAGPAAGGDLGPAAPDADAYRWSLSRGAVDVGVRFEPRTAAVLPADARFDSAAPAGSTLPALSLGLRRFSEGPAPAGSLVERALGSTTGVPSVSKVAIEWKP